MNPRRFRLIAFSGIPLLAVASALCVLAADTKDSKDPVVPARVETEFAETRALNEVGEIVDCTDYIIFGKKGGERRDIQVGNINTGMPACFISSTNGEIYLLVSPGGHAKDKFQPVANFYGGGVRLDGVVYEKGSFKALMINDVDRTGAYTDRQSRRPDNPQPNRKPGVKDPRINPSPPKEPSINP